jgi:hypothetical protein
MAMMRVAHRFPPTARSSGTQRASCPCRLGRKGQAFPSISLVLPGEAGEARSPGEPAQVPRVCFPSGHPVALTASTFGRPRCVGPGNSWTFPRKNVRPADDWSMRGRCHPAPAFFPSSLPPSPDRLLRSKSAPRRLRRNPLRPSVQHSLPRPEARVPRRRPRPQLPQARAARRRPARLPTSRACSTWRRRSRPGCASSHC